MSGPAIAKIQSKKRRQKEVQDAVSVDQYVADVEKAYDRWSHSARLYAEEAIGINGSTRPGMCVTSQQIKGLDLVTELVWAKIHAGLGHELTAEMEAMSKKIGISIMSGHGTGKDTYLAIVLIWFMDCFPWVRGLCTAPTEKALKNVLFSEVTKWLNLKDTEGNFVCIARDHFEVQQMKIMRTDVDKKRLGKGWFIEGRTAGRHLSAEEQGETLAGVHEDYMIMAVDEGSGVPDGVYLPMEGSLTGLCNFAIVIFNPTKRGGYAYQTHRGNNKDAWACLHWNAEDSERVGEQHIENMKKKYGAESNTYRIRVKGLPPLSDSDTLIPYDWAEEAQGRNPLDPMDPIIMGLDCALGGDEAIVMARQGMHVFPMTACPNASDTDELGAFALQQFYSYESTPGTEGADVLYVDVIGLGQGVYTYLKRFIPNHVVAVDVSNSASRIDKYFRLRDELWWKARELFEKKLITLPYDELLVSQFSDPKIDNDPYFAGKIKVESKKKLRSRNVGSPDRADAFVISLFRPDVYYRRAKNQKSRYNRNPKDRNGEKKSWMAN